MDESIRNEQTIREYLLGRVSDETTLEGIEELLFADEEFCSQVALAEDDLINDYVLGRLNEADAGSFRETLPGNTERSFKLKLTQALREKALVHQERMAPKKTSLLDSLKASFSVPAYAGAFAALVIAITVGAIYFTRSSRSDDLAELRSLYQTGRPTDTRLTTFDYAPRMQLRGGPEVTDKSRLRRIENNLIEANEKNSSAATHHALGVYYLTQQQTGDAIKELETAVRLAPGDASLHNDLGAAYFELSRTEPKENKLTALAQSLEEFTRATELDGNSLAALFNRALAQQEMALGREARASWTLYLQKDPSSKWAAEARKNLAQLDSEPKLSRSDSEVLSDFLAAYHQHDDSRAQQIHDETKGLMGGTNVPLQLSQRYLLARQAGNDAEAQESVEAMTYLGHYEQARHSDFFFLN